jgi:stress-induced morphogen
MDKRQTVVVITEVLRSLTDLEPIVSFEDDLHINAYVISDTFDGMTFSTRFRQLDTLIRTKLSHIHIKYLFNFEAFTKAEAEMLPADHKLKLGLISAHVKSVAAASEIPM